MKISVRIPVPLQKYTGNKAEIEVAGETIGELIEHLGIQYPGIKERLVDDQGSIHRFVNFYVNEEDIRFLEGKETLLKDGDKVTVIPAIAGGCSRRGVD